MGAGGHSAIRGILGRGVVSAIGIDLSHSADDKGMPGMMCCLFRRSGKQGLLSASRKGRGYGIGDID